MSTLVVRRLAVFMAMVVPGASASAEEPTGENAAAANPSETRYLFGPSAQTLDRGELMFSLKELVYASIEYGVTDHVSLSVSSVPIAWLTGPPTPPAANAFVAARAGFPIGEGVSLGMSLDAGFLPFAGSRRTLRFEGLAAALITLMPPGWEVTFSAGLPVTSPVDATAANAGRPFLGRLALTLSGAVPVGRHVSIVSENWLLFAPSPDFMGITTGSGHVLINSAAARLRWKEFSGDVGVALFSNSRGVAFPAPWIALAYRVRLLS